MIPLFTVITARSYSAGVGMHEILLYLGRRRARKRLGKPRGGGGLSDLRA